MTCHLLYIAQWIEGERWLIDKYPCRRTSVERGWKERSVFLVWWSSCSPDMRGAVSGQPPHLLLAGAKRLPDEAYEALSGLSTDP